MGRPWVLTPVGWHSGRIFNPAFYGPMTPEELAYIRGRFRNVCSILQSLLLANRINAVLYSRLGLLSHNRVFLLLCDCTSGLFQSVRWRTNEDQWRSSSEFVRACIVPPFVHHLSYYVALLDHLP
jgi:hypothetical protein